MAPVPSVQAVETQLATIVLSVVATAMAISMMALAVLGCGCCRGKKKEAEGADGAGGGGAGPADAKAMEGTTRKAPPSAGVTGGNRMYRTMLAVDKDDFVPSDKKEPTPKKKEGGGGFYIEVDAVGGGSVKKSEKKMADKKKEFASGRDPAYRSLMGVDDKFEPSNKAILIYRVLWFLPKRLLKAAHAILHFWIIILFAVGVAAVFDFHNMKSIPNLYSLHSWMGLGMVVAFIGQFLWGFVVYLLPYAPLSTRAMSMPFHRLLGMVIFGACGATALMGITEKAIFSSKDCWGNRTCSDADVINWFGISIFMYVASVLFLVATPNYRRQPQPSD